MLATSIDPASVSMQVVGIWFYDEAECAVVAGLLQRITAAFSGQPSSETLPSQARPSILHNYKLQLRVHFNWAQ